MAELNILHIYIIMILFSNISQYVNSYKRFSLPMEFSYLKRNLAEENICHPLGLKRGSIKIDKHSSRPYNSAIILRPSYIFDRWINRTSNLTCTFVVEVSKGEHLMAVIENIAFRKIGDECLDYVVFRREDHHKTEKFCGQFDRKKMNGYSSSVYGDFDVDGEIETTIFVSKESLRPDETPLNLTIIYTPYKSKDCNHLHSDNSVTPYRFLDKKQGCLAEEYFCDGIYNCIPAICMDEEHCSSEIFSNGTGSKVTIGAVTTILVGFIIFLMGLWICRRYKKLCWSSDCAGPSVNDDRLNNGEHLTSNSAHQTTPTAPMLEVSVLSSAVDKDLPPSYDSLFPEHTHPSST